MTLDKPLVDRRTFLTRLSALALVSRVAPRTLAGAKPEIMVPVPTEPWSRARRIIGGPDWIAQAKAGEQPTFFNDSCLIRDKTGRWHCMGIFGENGSDARLFHGVSDRVDGHYTMLEPIGSGRAARHMWAPFALWKDSQTALMFYAHMEDKGNGTSSDAIRILESRSPTLDTWHPLEDSRLVDGNMAFSEHYDRDPTILWDAERQCYFLYYVVGDGWVDPEPSNVVRVRQSTDLIVWSEPKTLMSPPTGYKAAESVFVVKRDGYYYLWVCGFDYGRMSLYISEDPLNFGDAMQNRIMEQSGHSPEIVQVGDRYWMACVSIASTFGNAPGAHDLNGVYVQPIKWVALEDSDKEKVVTRSA